jgi:hypothetical protein
MPKGNNFETIMGLAMLGALIGDQGNIDRTAANGNREAMQNPENQQKALDSAAMESKKLYDAYIRAGFAESQAFRLTEAALARVKTIKIMPIKA